MSTSHSLRWSLLKSVIHEGTMILIAILAYYLVSLLIWRPLARSVTAEGQWGWGWVLWAVSIVTVVSLCWGIWGLPWLLKKASKNDPVRLWSMLAGKNNRVAREHRAKLIDKYERENL